MMKKSLSNIDCFKIFDKNNKSNEKFSYGCEQEWYKTIWQRKAGCGPTVASNIVLYNKCKLNKGSIIKEDCLKIMEEMWEYVTPTMRGVYSTEIFYDGMISYAEKSGLLVDFKVLDIAKELNKRPNFSEILRFLDTALKNDLPVAFLNLCNGEEKCLDKWHWVTIISLEYCDDGTAFVEIIDEGKIIKIDLLLWYNTTTLGGGFLSFFDKSSLQPIRNGIV